MKGCGACVYHASRLFLRGSWTERASVSTRAHCGKAGVRSVNRAYTGEGETTGTGRKCEAVEGAYGTVDDGGGIILPVVIVAVRVVRYQGAVGRAHGHNLRHTFGEVCARVAQLGGSD